MTEISVSGVAWRTESNHLIQSLCSTQSFLILSSRSCSSTTGRPGRFTPAQVTAVRVYVGGAGEARAECGTPWPCTARVMGVHAASRHALISNRSPATASQPPPPPPPRPRRRPADERALAGLERGRGWKGRGGGHGVSG